MRVMRGLMLAMVSAASLVAQSSYDPALGAKLKADDNGMCTDVMARNLHLRRRDRRRSGSA
jgi:hypothetical protein